MDLLCTVSWPSMNQIEENILRIQWNSAQNHALYSMFFCYPVIPNPSKFRFGANNYLVVRGSQGLTLARFILIVVISATIAGIVGGVTSSIKKIKTKTSDDGASQPSSVNPTLTNSTNFNTTTMKSDRMVGRMFIA